MGKKKNRNRRIARGTKGDGTNVGAFHNNNNNNNNSMMVGFINPQFLAEQAKMLRKSKQQQQQQHQQQQIVKQQQQSGQNNNTTALTSNNSSNPAIIIAGSSKRKRKNKKERQSSSSSSSTTNNNPKMTNKKSKHSTTTNDEKSPSNNNNNYYYQPLQYRFGHPKWTRMEQLCHIILSSRRRRRRKQQQQQCDKKNKDISSSTCTTVPNNTPITTTTTNDDFSSLIMIFTNDVTSAKQIAMTFKPVIHPSFSFVCHAKMKRDQLARIINDVTKNEKSSFNNDDEDDDNNMSSSLHNNHLIVLSDNVLPIVSSHCCNNSNSNCRRRRRSSSSSDNNNNNNNSHSSTTTSSSTPRLITIHLSPPSLDNLRHDTARNLLSLLLHPSSSDIPSWHDIYLDGTPSSIDVTNDDNNNNNTTLTTTTTIPIPINHYPIYDHYPTTNALRSTYYTGLVNTAIRIYNSSSSSSSNNNNNNSIIDRERYARLNLKARLVGYFHFPKMKVSELMEKMKILEMLYDGGGGGERRRREAALTSWLDGDEASQHGGSWMGSIRHGASLCPAANQLSHLLASHRRPKTSTTTTQQQQSSSWHDVVFSQWQPNPSNGSPSSSDDYEDTSSSCYLSCPPCTKACSHNETVMFYLRPYAPLVVLNTTICSKLKPAPGNRRGVDDGCLEFLRYACGGEGKGRGMNFWDVECFGFVDGGGGVMREGKAKVYRWHKKELLSLSTNHLKWIMIVMKEWTLFRFRYFSQDKAACHPKRLYEGIDMVLTLAYRAAVAAAASSSSSSTGVVTKTTTTKRESDDDDYGSVVVCLNDLPYSVTCHIMRFVLHGTEVDWLKLKTIHLD